MGQAVEADDGVVREELVRATGDGEMVAQVGSGLAEVHGRDVKGGGNPLVESCEDPETELTGERGLAEENAGGAG